MSSHNMVGLQGRLGADPELRYLEPSGTPCAKVNIAVDVYGGKDESGKGQNRPVWVTVKAYDKTATMLADHFRKGDAILVAGRLDMDNWVDKESGQKRNMLYVRADRISFCGSRRTEVDSPGDREMAQRAPREPAGASQPDDDVPF